MKGNEVKNKGFTLIELMIVFTIMGILAAITVPAYKAHRNRVQTTYSEPITLEDDSVRTVPASECIEGYKFYNGLQIKDTAGNGISC